MDKNQRPKLGQVCIIKKVVSKSRSNLGGVSLTSFYAADIHPRKALYIGWRTWSVGTSIAHHSYEDYGGGIESTEVEYKPAEYRVVWCFVESERRNPFYAFPEDVSPDLCGAPAV